MIIRFWRAVAGSDEVLDACADHLRRTTFVEMAELPGHLGATLARKVRGADNELVVMSFWADMDSAGREKKVVMGQGAALCSTGSAQSGGVTSKLDCKSTGTVAGSDGSANAQPRLGYSTSPWFVLSGF